VCVWLCMYTISLALKQIHAPSCICLCAISMHLRGQSATKRNIMKHSNFVHKCIKQNCSIFAPNLACLACLACLAYIMCCSPCGVNSWTRFGSIDARARNSLGALSTSQHPNCVWPSVTPWCVWCVLRRLTLIIYLPLPNYNTIEIIRTIQNHELTWVAGMLRAYFGRRSLRGFQLLSFVFGRPMKSSCRLQNQKHQNMSAKAIECNRDMTHVSLCNSLTITHHATCQEAFCRRLCKSQPSKQSLVRPSGQHVSGPQHRTSKEKLAQGVVSVAIHRTGLVIQLVHQWPKSWLESTDMPQIGCRKSRSYQDYLDYSKTLVSHVSHWKSAECLSHLSRTGWMGEFLLKK